MFKFLFFSLIFCSTSCLHKKCDDSFNNAREQKRDTALMYLWRYTDNLIKPDGQYTDSGFRSFKSNGDYCWSSDRKNINSFADIWYTKDSLFCKAYCLDNVPNIDNIKYIVKNDTLSMWSDMGDGTFNKTPKTYIKVLKY
jgi:hypothetical protein